MNRLYNNNRGGTFADATGDAGLGGMPDRRNAGATFIDYGRGGHPDCLSPANVDD